MRRARLSCFILVLLTPQFAYASSDTATGSQATIKFGNFVLKLEGDLRMSALRLSGIPVLTADPGGDRIPLEESLSVRLRWRPSLTWNTQSRAVSTVAVMSEVDLLDGMAFVGKDREVLMFSRASRIEQDLFSPDNIRFNAAYLLVHSPFFTFLGGRQKSHTGLGMVANNGNDKPDDFGIRRMVDLVDRGTIILRPLVLVSEDRKYAAFSVAAGFDHVERDLFADRGRNDRAYQAFGQVQFKPSFGQMGVVYLHRWQKNSIGDRTRFHLVDAFADVSFAIGDISLGMAGEWAIAVGSTEVPRSIVNPEGVDIRSAGFVLRASVGHRLGRLVVEFGRASGDANPYDGTYSAFTMNPDYRVGLIMFHEYLKALSAVAAWNASRTWFQEVPPRGIQAIPTDGGVQNAIYANPRLTLTPLKWLDVMVGFLFARADSPIVDPFWLSVSGSTSTSGCVVQGGKAPGPRCGPASKDIGYEIDTAVRGKVQLGPVGLTGVIEYGFFKPGKAFADTSQKAPPGVHMLQTRLHVSW